MSHTKWTRVEYSKNQIEKAGKILTCDTASKAEMQEASKIMNNWRAAHAYPLRIIFLFLNRLARSSEKSRSIIVAQRLKREESIKKKLRFQKSMNLWRMQDLGGCRVIAPSVDEVYEFRDRITKSSIRHVLKNEKDYITNPKQSGYRGIHLVYQYQSASMIEYNHNMLIEIQIRTQLQHVWATAVETMDLFTNESIKSGRGSEEVKRFFALTSSLFAWLEGKPAVSGTPDNLPGIVDEIRRIEDSQKFLDFLTGVRVITKLDNKSLAGKDGYCVLALQFDEKRNVFRLNTNWFADDQIDAANGCFNYLENNKANSRDNVVLVKVSSFRKLKKAYPNYFADIAEFVATVRKAIG